MTPTETAAILRQFNEWRRGKSEMLSMPDPRAVGEAFESACKMIERLAGLTSHITPKQAPDGVRDYSHEAAEGYADGWNDCIKAMTEAA
jgi:hypothetical protein